MPYVGAQTSRPKGAGTVGGCGGPLVVVEAPVVVVAGAVVLVVPVVLVTVVEVLAAWVGRGDVEWGRALVVGLVGRVVAVVFGVDVETEADDVLGTVVDLLGPVVDRDVDVDLGRDVVVPLLHAASSTVPLSNRPGANHHARRGVGRLTQGDAVFGPSARFNHADMPGRLATRLFLPDPVRPNWDAGGAGAPCG